MPGRGFHLSELPAKRQRAATSQHAGGRSPAASGKEGWDTGTGPCSDTVTHLGKCVSCQRKRSKTGELVQALLRHSNIRTTLDVYA